MWHSLDFSVTFLGVKLSIFAIEMHGKWKSFYKVLFFFVLFFFFLGVLGSFKEYFTYIKQIVHQRWAKTGEPVKKTPDHL